jgi:hypothetical protein
MPKPPIVDVSSEADLPRNLPPNFLGELKEAQRVYLKLLRRQFAGRTWATSCPP